ncbi:formyl-CoA transferase [Thermocatellispora tengchongensis]|uniref:Formyl-CoA transferase n=2 Tax=Thermocatellispora tengchongensis TaxID=1073253 RepID=A0A840PIA7_9ACTN|nr:formyl-CoA transferase [Thermocatellispora tengchongensis]
MMLGDLGARVIKVEAPGHGDDTRRWGPPFLAPLGQRAYEVRREAEQGSESTYFLSANRNKASIALDLKTPEDRETLLRLIDRADVLVENFRTGVLERLGLDFDTLLQRNPRLIALSITGFGHDGPEGGRSGYDQIAQGEAGLMSFTGPPDQPAKVGTPISDILAGMYGAYGVLAALHERERTGRGQIVRTSLLAATIGVHAFQGTRWTCAGEIPVPEGNHHVSIAPYGLFRCADGEVQIAIGSERLWRDFCAGFGIDPGMDGLGTNPERVARRAEVIELINRVFAEWSTEDLIARLDQIGVPAGRVRSLDEVYEWEQTRSQRLLIDVDHSSLGRLVLPGPPLRFFSPDGEEVTRTEHQAPPTLGEHQDAVLRWLEAAQ